MGTQVTGVLQVIGFVWAFGEASSSPLLTVDLVRRVPRDTGLPIGIGPTARPVRRPGEAAELPRETFRAWLRQAVPMHLPVRRETLVFALLVVVLGWLLIDAPLVEKSVRTGAALVVFLLASWAIERLRERYLGDHLDEE